MRPPLRERPARVILVWILAGGSLALELTLACNAEIATPTPGTGGSTSAAAGGHPDTGSDGAGGAPGSAGRSGS